MGNIKKLENDCFLILGKIKPLSHIHTKIPLYSLIDSLKDTILSFDILSVLKYLSKQKEVIKIRFLTGHSVFDPIIPGSYEPPYNLQELTEKYYCDIELIQPQFDELLDKLKKQSKASTENIEIINKIDTYIIGINGDVTINQKDKKGIKKGQNNPIWFTPQEIKVLYELKNSQNNTASVVDFKKMGIKAISKVIASIRNKLGSNANDNKYIKTTKDYTFLKPKTAYILILPSNMSI